MKVKICGLHPVRDVQLCIDLGVNFLGFVFYSKSPRNVNLKEIKLLKNYNKLNSKFSKKSKNVQISKFCGKNKISNFRETSQKKLKLLRKPCYEHSELVLAQENQLLFQICKTPQS